ncbi:permease (plasmid) [Fulvitalea axinellae]|uniref:Permease n=1 Tax=Fulvitalea axinellae TaxID=1182444 RepID=A0AAU9CHJ7_9BACT|nr:permease [Fulvitalea axinellae]
MLDKSIAINRKANGWLLPILLLLIWIVIYRNLTAISDFIVLDLMGMQAGEHLTETLRFFIFEVPKVMLLLALIIFVVGVLRTYVTPEKTRSLLEGKSLFTGNILASVLGIITPFCSCSAIPLFLGFIEAGVPLGVTFSFLIAAPMINEVALILLAGMFGWKIAMIYVLTGLAIAIFSGWIIAKLRLERYVANWVYKVKSGGPKETTVAMTQVQRVAEGFSEVKSTVGKIWLYIVIGIAVGAGAHGYVPEDFLGELLGKDNLLAVPMAIVFGVPMYSNAAGVIPIVSVLIEKGVSLGTALAFMMSVIALSLPEIIILKKVLKWQLIAVFVGIVTLGIISVGFLFNHIIQI